MWSEYNLLIPVIPLITNRIAHRSSWGTDWEGQTKAGKAWNGLYSPGGAAGAHHISMNQDTGSMGQNPGQLEAVALALLARCSVWKDSTDFWNSTTSWWPIVQTCIPGKGGISLTPDPGGHRGCDWMKRQAVMEAVRHPPLWSRGKWQSFA